jgi:hypothetical protein
MTKKALSFFISLNFIVTSSIMKIVTIIRYITVAKKYHRYAFPGTVIRSPYIKLKTDVGKGEK